MANQQADGQGRRDPVTATKGARRSAAGDSARRAGSRGAGETTAGAVRRTGSRDKELPVEVRDELRRAVGRDRSAGLERRLSFATRAYERDHYPEALAELRALVALAPEVPAVRELYGLTLYRLGRWRQAARELRQFHELTGSFDQHPVIADCERALGHEQAVERLWEQLRHAGVDREVLVEGRLVLAGMLADKGDIEGAMEVLRPGPKLLRHPDSCHLRQWYALGDLYERAGDLPRARELFERVATFAPDLSDVSERLAALR